MIFPSLLWCVCTSQSNGSLVTDWGGGGKTLGANDDLRIAGVREREVNSVMTSPDRFCKHCPFVASAFHDRCWVVFDSENISKIRFRFNANMWVRTMYEYYSTIGCGVTLSLPNCLQGILHQ